MSSQNRDTGVLRLSCRKLRLACVLDSAFFGSVPIDVKVSATHLVFGVIPRSVILHVPVRRVTTARPSGKARGQSADANEHTSTVNVQDEGL